MRTWMRRWLLVPARLGIAALAGLTLVRVTGVERETPFVQLVSFTPYLLPVAVLLAALLLICRQWTPAGLAGLLAVVLALLLLPRVLADGGARIGVPLRVMTANLLYGQATGELAELVRRERPDVLSVQELTPQAVAALDAAGIGELLPYRVLRPPSGVAGTGLYAREPLTDRGQLSDRTPFEMARAGVHHRGIALDLVAVHTTPPVPGALDRFHADFRRLPAAAADGEVTILAGDFNASLDHRVFRDLLARGYRDAAATSGDGLAATWTRRRIPPVTIDHVLAERPSTAGAVRTHRLDSSDHRALTADLLLNAPGAGSPMRDPAPG